MGLFEGRADGRDDGCEVGSPEGVEVGTKAVGASVNPFPVTIDAACPVTVSTPPPWVSMSDETFANGNRNRPTLCVHVALLMVMIPPSHVTPEGVNTCPKEARITGLPHSRHSTDLRVPDD